MEVGVGVQDTAAALRTLASVDSDDPRAIYLLPDTYREGQTQLGSGDISTDLSSWTVSYNRGEGAHISYADQARLFIQENGMDVTADYLTRAIEETRLYLSFYTEPRVFLSYLFRELMSEGVSTRDIAEAYTEWEGTGIRTQPLTIERFVEGREESIEEAHAANQIVIRRQLAPLSQAIESVKPALILDRSRLYAKSAVTITLDGEPLNISSLIPLMKLLQLDERLFYAAKRTGVSNVYRVHQGARLTEDLPSSDRGDELLLLVAVPGQKNREIRISALSSSVSVNHDDDLNLFLNASEGRVEMVNRINLSLSATFTLEYRGVHLLPLYYFIQTTFPWQAIIGVEDSQYDRGQNRPRTFLFRYDLYPLYNATGVDREEVVRVEMSTIRVLHRGRVVEGLLFSMSNVNDSQAERVEYVISRLLADYYTRQETLTSIYEKAWGDSLLLSPYEPSPSRPMDTLQLLRPSIFGGGYLNTCDKKRPILIQEEEYDEEDPTMAEVDGVYISCEEAGKSAEVEWRPRRDAPLTLVPCCVPTRGRKNIITQDQELDPGKEGFLLGLAHLFGLRERERKGQTEVVRVGVDQSMGGLRSSLSLALGTEWEDALERPFMAPFRQSMWSHTTEEIREVLSFTDLDSDLVVDGIAAHLSLNIFIIEPVKGKLRFRVPLHKFAYYIPFYADRKCILLYRYTYRRRVIYEPIRLFSSSAHIHPIEVSLNCIQSFRAQNVTELLNRDGSYFSLPDAGPYRASAIPTQVIDGYGKSRGYVQNGLVHYYEHPRAPLLGEFVEETDEEVNAQAYINRRVKEEVMIAGEQWKNVPIGTALRGLPVSRVLEADNDTEGDERIELTWDLNRVQQFHSLHRERSYLLQLTNWLYSLLYGTSTADEFVSLVEVDPNITYDFNILPQELGEYEWEDALAYLENTGLTVPNSNILMKVPSEGVKRGLRQMLLVENETRSTPYPVIPDELIGLQEDEESRRLLPDGRLAVSAFLTSNISYSGWLSTSSSFILDHSNRSVTDLTDELKSHKYPFTLVSVSKTRGVQRWLVQNVANGSYQRSMNCCAAWLLRHTGRSAANTGFYTPVIGSEASNALRYTVVYTRDESGLLTPDVEVDPTGTYLTILAYPGAKRTGSNLTGHFAALLPLTPT